MITKFPTLRLSRAVRPVTITPQLPPSLVAARSNPDLTFLAAGAGAGAGAGGDTYCFGDESAKGSGSKGEKQVYAKSTRKLNRNGGR